MAFTEEEIEYINTQPLARVATVGPDGQPDVVPVGFKYDGTYFWIGGYNPTRTRRTRNIQAGNEKVALVIDDLAPGGGWKPRFLRVYGSVDLVETPQGSGTLVMRITPETSWSMAINPTTSHGARSAFETTKTRHG